MRHMMDAAIRNVAMRRLVIGEKLGQGWSEQLPPLPAT
jgi:hypothetical protein